MADLLIRNALVVDPSQGLNAPMDILVEKGRIADLHAGIPEHQAERVVDARGLVATPGFIDLKAQLREPGGEGAETIESGTRAAAAGGFTTVFAMPNTNPVCDTLTGVHYVLSRAKTQGCVRVIPVAAITIGQKGEELTNIGILQDGGAGAFSDSSSPIMNAAVMRRALEYCRALDAPLFVHCEDTNLAGDGAMHEGRVSLELGLRGIPRVAESTMVARDAALAMATGGRLHVCHVSTRESVEALREAKRNGVRITAEVTPHHLTLTDEAVRGYNTDAKMRPPLCAEADRLALVAALEDGTIDCISTDHAPHAGTAKNNVFDAAPFGVIGLESAFPVLYTRFVATGLWTLDFLVEKLTTGPASVVRRPWGTLKVGSPADIALLEVGVAHMFTTSDLRGRSRNCPWLGHEMQARVAATLSEGAIAFESTRVFPKGLLGPRDGAAAPVPAPAKKVKKKASKPARAGKK
mgnify:CR=1 FL=1